VGFEVWVVVAVLGRACAIVLPLPQLPWHERSLLLLLLLLLPLPPAY